MSSYSTKRTRSERVASLQTNPGFFAEWFSILTRGPSILRIAMALATVLVVTISMRGWNPPFAFREGYIPTRSIMARVPFQMPDPNKTAIQKAQAGKEVLCYYENRPQPLIQLQAALKDRFSKLYLAESLEKLQPDERQTLDELTAKFGTSDEPTISPQDALAAIVATFSDKAQQEKFDLVMKGVMDPINEKGLLKSLGHDIDKGNQRLIRVYPEGLPKNERSVEVDEVRVAEVTASLKSKLKSYFHREFNTPEAAVIADLAYNFLAARFPDSASLSYNAELSDAARKNAIDSVKTAMILYQPGVTTLVRGGKPLDAGDISVLRVEYETWLDQQLTLADWGIRFLAFVGMLFALYLLVGIFIYYQFDRTLLTDSLKLFRLLSLSSLCIIVSGFLAIDPWRMEIIPVIFCAVTAMVAYGRSLSLLLMTALTIAITLSLGLDLAEFVVLASAASTTIMLLGRIQKRTRLLWVGLGTAAVTAATAIGVGIMVGQSGGSMRDPEAITSGVIPLLNTLYMEAGRVALFTFVSCLLVMAVLPVVEWLFDVQTDLRLMELGNPSNDLLRQLAQRAPGTYNHSINVASIAEAAADAIGAHGLLTRVGAYFHDIGKMFKPNYFVENQGQGANRHDALQPAMSTLVIIAHVKDGADLARQHKLPKPIIDFIEQHHGTTLVEYFYRKEAAKKSEENPNEEVSELNFRYPGPKPQSLEAAVLMLADAVESASRSLVEPTPARIQSLVEQIAMKRLLDGQFDECGLTLKQLELVKRSLVKTLTSIYHGRVKYPGQQTA